jgi:hypothetical protein
VKALRLYWHCLDLGQQEEEETRNWLDELRQLLAQPPTQADLCVSNVPSDISEVFDMELRRCPITPQPMERYLDAIITKLGHSYSDLWKWTPLLVRCLEDSPIALAAKKENPLAEWGIALGLWAVVYAMNNKYIIWHESLHLYTAEDCYCRENPEGPTTCELPGCIMQYAPCEGKVAPWPFLCRKNLDHVRSYRPFA